MPRILVVDDDPDVCNTVQRILFNNGYEVATFQEARKAIEDANTQAPDLILMDLMMPKLTGEEAIKELKNTSNLANIPIIILTGLISAEEMTNTTVDGKSYRILGKPYKMEALVTAVKESLLHAGLPLSGDLNSQK